MIDYTKFQKELVHLRRHFHMYPETAFKEFATTDFIVDYLQNAGYSVKKTHPTGCYAFLNVKENAPTVIVRAEIDAVPIDENTGLSFASKNKGAMHACGHDANMAVALVLAKLCQKTKDSLSCNVKFVFEPAEEIGSGAKVMIESGVLENPKADSLIMFHFVNKASGGMEVNKDIASAAIGRIEIEFKGVSAHWAASQKGRDAINAACLTSVELYKLNQSYSSKYPFCIGIGQIQGGTSPNVMSDYAKINGNLRASSMKDYLKLADIIKDTIEKIQNQTGVNIKYDVSKDPITPIINNPYMVKKAAQTGKEVFGDEFYIVDKLYLAGDNACIYFENIPGILMVFRSKSQTALPLHNPKFVLSEDCFYKALETLHKYIINLYKI